MCLPFVPYCLTLTHDTFIVRWGLYESAHKFVGYPIVPGFDVAGTVEQVGSKVANLRVGDRVFGCTFFGAYSSRILIPASQLRVIPSNLTTAQAASLPAVTLTALYALFLAGHYPIPSKFKHRGILIQSAAGGVGSMLVQLSKLLGLSPIVGVVGRSPKIETAKALGCDVVIDKSQDDLWEAARAAAPAGFSCVMESNGIATLRQSYEHLAMTGRLIVYGFHTNLPMGKDMLSPMECKSASFGATAIVERHFYIHSLISVRQQTGIRMAMKQQSMPKFDAMEMGSENKAILAFNLSFFSEEQEMFADFFEAVLDWIRQRKLECPRITEFEGLDKTTEAHELIQSGQSVGKLIITL